MKKEIEYSNKYAIACLLFNGMSEANNFNFIVKNYDNITKEGKYYTIIDNNCFCAKTIGKYDLYRLLELINFGYKYIYTLLSNFPLVEVSNLNEKNIILENLDFLEIKNREIKEKDNNIKFIFDGKLIANIIVNENLMELSINFDDLYKYKDHFHEVPKEGMEICVFTKDDTIMDEVILVTVMLRDLGYKTEFIKDINEIEDYDPEFIIETSEKLAKKYSVKLIDNKTKEEKIVLLNNLGEVLEYNF